MLFKDELGANPKPYESYHHKYFRGLECFWTQVAIERSPVVPGRLLPFACWRVLLFVFGGRLSTTLEGQFPFILEGFNSCSQISRKGKGIHRSTQSRSNPEYRESFHFDY